VVCAIKYVFVSASDPAVFAKEFRNNDGKVGRRFQQNVSEDAMRKRRRNDREKAVRGTPAST